MDSASGFLPFDKRIEHAQKGYSNAQDVIKFIDTKTGVITALSGITIGFPFAVMQWAFDLDKDKRLYPVVFQQNHPLIAEVITYGFSCSLILAVLSILCSMHSLMGRNPRRPYQGMFEQIQKMWRWLSRQPLAKSSEAVTILFPVYQPHLQEKAIAYFRKISSALAENDVAREYELQLAEIGKILNLKIRWHRRAVSLFQAQMIALLVSGLLSFILQKCGR